MGFFETIGDVGKAALGGVGMGISALGRAFANRKRKKRLGEQERFNNAWYDQHSNELFTETNEGANALRKLNDAMAKRYSASRGLKALGATDGAVMKAVGNQQVAESIGQLAALGDARSRDYQNAYLAEKRRIAGTRDDIDNSTGQAMTDAGSRWSELIAKMYSNKTT